MGLPLDVLGVLSCTALPGCLLTLLALHLVESELERVDGGQLSVEHRPALARLKGLAMGGLGFCMAGFALQLYLLSSGFYQRLLALL